MAGLVTELALTGWAQWTAQQAAFNRPRLVSFWHPNASAGHCALMVFANGVAPSIWHTMCCAIRAKLRLLWL